MGGEPYMGKYDVIVIGAGFGGLTAAAKLAKKGKSVCVFEASNELGGCAGRFKRQDYQFPVGATLGMGFEQGGVLASLYEELGVPKPQLIDMAIIMDVHIQNETIRYWKDKNKWYQELAKHFPQDYQQIIKFYEEIFKVGRLIDEIIDAQPVFPPRSASQLLKLLPLANGRTARLVPFLTQTVADRLHKFGLLDSQKFVQFLNGQLIDSVQTTVENSPAFLGYAALQTFHKGAFSIEGGLATVAYDLADFIKKNDGDVKKKHVIEVVQKEGNHWKVVDQKGREFAANKIISNNSLHNVHGMLPTTWRNKLRVKETKESQQKAWGAFTLYIGCKDLLLPKEMEDSLFHQFIKDSSMPLSEGNQFLLSISSKDDDILAPKGKRAITISTHTIPDIWWDTKKYDELKEYYMNSIVETINQRFPGFKSSIEVMLPGTPVTFQRFIQRRKGKVGGYIPNGPYSWLRGHSCDSGIKGLWFCGDTIFPGAGTLGTTLSGIIAAEEASK